MKENIKIVQVPIIKLIPAQFNPRKWQKQAIHDLKESIKHFGLIDPILVNGAPNRKNIVIGGHFRLQIAKDLGFEKVPVIYLNIPNLKKEKELNLRLNRNTGEWDFEILKECDIGLLMDVGFDNNDLSTIWDEALEIEDDNFDVDKEIQKIKTSKIKPGDLFQLGPHRLLCGDSTDLETVKKLVGKTKIDMVYSDPPYNIRLNYNTGIGTTGKYGSHRTKDNKSVADYEIFLKKTIENALEVSKPDCHFFYWCDENHIGSVQELYKILGIKHQRVCLWIKNNPNMTPQLAFNKIYEPCIYGIRGRPYLSPTLKNFHEILNKEVTTGNRVSDDILDLLNIWLVKKLPTQTYEHPTQKPPQLHEKALRRCTKVGDNILDLFGGSGSTLVAADQLKRNCYLVEIEPLFCDLIIKRYEKLTNQKAKKLN